MPRHTTTLPAATTVTLPNGTQVTSDRAAAVTQWTASAPGFRGPSSPADIDVTPQWTQALAEVGIREQETLHIDVQPLVTRAGLRETFGRDEIVIRPAQGATAGVNVVLYQDEGGGLSWHLPDQSAPVFTIPARSVAAQAVLAGKRPLNSYRGPITKIGRKIFKVLVVPILEPLLEHPVQKIVQSVEAKHRRENIRAVTPENYRSSVAEPFSDWGSLAGKRSLLIVHGILSTTEGMLSQLPPAAMAELYAGYGGRVIAIDHLSVSRSPEENARFFLESVAKAKPAAPLEFDILCHSRGGIVARTLVERGQTLVPAHGCTFRKVCFVATPNRGSRLADPDHMLDMVDVFTNLITNFPDGPVTYSIEVLLAIVKLLVHTAEHTLPGLAAMGTKGYISDVLNSATEKSPAQYAAVAADYTPDRDRDNSFFAGSAGNRIMDRIFTASSGPEANDLVVPFEGVFAANGHPSFPLQLRYEFKSGDHVWHTGFFARRETMDWIKRHFELGAQAAFSPPPASMSPRYRSAPPPKPFGGAAGARPTAAAPAYRGPSAAPPPGAPQPQGPSSQSETQLRRSPSIGFRDQVTEGQTEDLTVSLTEPTVEALNTLVVTLERGAESVSLDVTLFAPGFDVLAPEHTRMTLKPQRDPALEQLVFKLTALSPGTSAINREIRADFWLRNIPVGSVSYRTTVLPAGASSAAAPGTGNEAPPARAARDVEIPKQRREDCDWIISVDSDDESGQPPFRLRLRSEISGQEYGVKKAGSMTLDGGVANYVATTLDSVFAGMPQDIPGADMTAAWSAWQEEFNAILDALGKSLWDLLPLAFRTEYFRLHDAGASPASILIHSDEMVLPWELIIPYDAAHRDLAPLGAAHVIGRWRTDMNARPPTQKLNVTKFCVLNPTYSGADALPWSAIEAVELKKRFSGITAIKPASMAIVRTSLLNRCDVQFLHFSGHGSYNATNADLSALLLEDSELKAILLTGSDLMLRAQPLVYLNACNAGQSGVIAGKMAGLAAIMLKGGSSGVVAPHWAIEDESAMQFALALYDKLALGRAIGEALQELRREHPKDPTFRAFTYFGDPWVRLSFAAIS